MEDLIVGLFGGNNGAGYEFNNITLPASPTSGTGSFTITFLNNGGQIPTISHLDVIGGNPRTPINTPEPASLAIFGSALLGLGAVLRIFSSFLRPTRRAGLST